MRVVIVTYSKFPEGDAGAVRAYIFTKMLKDLGIDVFVVGMGNEEPFCEREFKGVKYTSLRKKGANKFLKVIHYIMYSFDVTRKIKQYNLEKPIDYLWVVNLPILSILLLKKFAIKNKIKLIHDSVEWYSSSQFKLRYFSPSFISKNLLNRFLIDRHFKVIAISKFLEKYYSSKGITTMRIPVLLDSKEVPYSARKNDSEKITIIYAGSPGNKDFLDIILKGVGMLNSEQLSKVKFIIIGLNMIEVKKLLNDDVLFNTIKSSLSIIGRVSREEVIKYLKKSDYSILLRPAKKRYAKAGFPTKVVESLSVGIPPILNITSDLEKYIIDEVNGVIVEECSPESLCKALQRALEIKKYDRGTMSWQARKTFEDNFDYRLYLSEFEKFMNRPY